MDDMHEIMLELICHVYVSFLMSIRYVMSRLHFTFIYFLTIMTTTLSSRYLKWII